MSGWFWLRSGGTYPQKSGKIWNRFEMISADFIPTICIRSKFHSNLIKFLARFPVSICYTIQLSLLDDIAKKILKICFVMTSIQWQLSSVLIWRDLIFGKNIWLNGAKSFNLKGGSFWICWHRNSFKASFEMQLQSWLQ